MTVQQTELHDRMETKLALLQKISTNTKIQIDFIHQRKMKGLLRLLNERGEYLKELEVLNQEFDNNTAAITANAEMRNMMMEIKAKQKEILKDNNEALRAAKAEQEQIAADLRGVHSNKKFNNSYDYQWVKISGSQLNQKG